MLLCLCKNCWYYMNCPFSSFSVAPCDNCLLRADYEVIYIGFRVNSFSLLLNWCLNIVCYACLSSVFGVRSVVCYFLSMILQWVTVPSMGRRWTRSQVDAGGLTARNGGAPKTPTRTPSTVSATCTVAATVQESLWNHKLLHSLLRLWLH